MTPKADLLITNARVLTMDDANPRAGAIAVADGRIIAVGTTENLDAYRVDTTKVINARQATVLPGFSENHLHIFSGSAELDHLQLAGVEGLQVLSAQVRAYADARPDEKILFGQGCDYTILGGSERLTRHHLDSIMGDRALALFAHDHHTVWANTKALEMANILNGAQLRPGNEVVMGEDGLATGELREMEAFAPLLEISGYDRYRLGLATGGEPDPYPHGVEWEKDLAVMKRGLDYCARHGITSLQNMDGNLYQLELLQALRDRDGSISCRVKIPFHFKNFMSLDMLDKASMMAERYNDEWLSSGMVKVFYDGVLDSWTAVMIEPYADRPEAVPEPLFSPEAFKEIAVEADRRGLQVAVHAIGDGAVRAVFDGYEEARNRNGARDSRHRIEHIEVIHPDDIPRFASLGVIASMQPSHAPGTLDLPAEPTVSRIGPRRWRYSYAWRVLKDAGAHIPFSSDWPVAPIGPIHTIKAAMTRQLRGPEDIDQRFTLMEALAAYTVEGAYAEFSEQAKGMIKPGYLADIVILNEDIEAIAPDELHIVRPVMTICGGSVTYSE